MVLLLELVLEKGCGFYEDPKIALWPPLEGGEGLRIPQVGRRGKGLCALIKLIRAMAYQEPTASVRPNRDL